MKSKISTDQYVPIPRWKADNFKEVMLNCVQDAVAIVAEVKEVPFQTEDIRSIAATLFIGRTKVGL